MISKNIFAKTAVKYTADLTKFVNFGNIFTEVKIMEYTLIRSKRKTVSLEVSENLQVIVRAPLDMSVKRIEEFVTKNEKWIEKAKERVINLPQFDKEEINKLYKIAKEILPEKIERYSELMGLKPTHVSITKAKTRFGSCSNKGRICFSVYLFAYPEKAIDYVVVHELAHLKYLNHSKEFYSLIEHYLPDYKERKALLKNGGKDG